MTKACYYLMPPTVDTIAMPKRSKERENVDAGCGMRFFEALLNIYKCGIFIDKYVNTRL